ncbi:hypothetical protein [Kribbella sindirgiensis]|uniref:Uncharacterized protein n=1 Tax=Kribbella sindirgiensis TaxID=1124744 RepID=A0A4R0HXE2_9ACTN|nr:hypothetical protein [Kribbella sindirgiensis]TCC16280.1 hypothetical protein E0H50_40550 [Kribbella sindirgiensis]
MDDAELLQIEEQLRTLLEGTDLEWVLDEVDEAIAEGVPEEGILRRRPRKARPPREQDLWSDAAEEYMILNLRQIESGELEASRKSGTLVVTTRPMTVRERVLLLLDAVRRVIVELPAIEAETLDLLQAEPGRSVDYERTVTAVVFEPEEGFRRRRDRQTKIAHRMTSEDRERVSALFTAIREEAGVE